MERSGKRRPDGEDIFALFGDGRRFDPHQLSGELQLGLRDERDLAISAGEDFMDVPFSNLDFDILGIDTSNFEERFALLDGAPMRCRRSPSTRTPFKGA
ncbi:MAG: hypothetical protein U1G07_20555 [Verrucomicrobiota bacterium]